ncbi:MAG: hypothetical protein AAFR38_04355 [Planctomycetota bacterium]
MNWLAFAVVAWVSLGLELGLAEALRLAPGDIGPSFVIPLATWIGLRASPKHALWAALLLGLLLDLGWTVALRDSGGLSNIIGPYSIGLFLGVNLVLAARGYVLREHIVALAVMSLLCAGATQVFVTAILTLRNAYDPIAWQAGDELTARGASALYTCLLALLLWLPFRGVEPLMAFPRGPIARRYG